VEMQLRGKVIVVVGGARGIGAAIAEEFAREGAHVAILDPAPEVIATAETLLGSGVSAIGVQVGAPDYGNRSHAKTQRRKAAVGWKVDATDYGAVQAAAARVEAELGPCDHVVYAAGCGSGKVGFPFWNLEPADWDRVLRVNLLGAVNTAHAFAPALAERRNGTLLFLASVAGQIGSQTDPPYSAAKAAVINFAQCAARDLAPFGVRVNTICPGMVKTDLNRSVWRAWNERQAPSDQLDYEAWGAEKVSRVAPLGRWQQPSEIAAMAVYLASPHAENITGQTLNVDGGQVMG